MSERSAFDKLHVEDSEKDDLGGVLEQLNLPPAVVTYVREHKRLVQTVIAAVVVIIVVLSLYRSYRLDKIEDAASALSVAVSLEDSEAKLGKLSEVTVKYKGTTSALWAKINSGHELIKTGKSQEAVTLYRDILDEIDDDSALYPLVSSGLAQGYEKIGEFAEAAGEYEKIKAIDGYQSIGYLGLARISEEQGENGKAIAIYEEYLSTLMNVNEQGQKGLVEEKIARLKAIQ